MNFEDHSQFSILDYAFFVIVFVVSSCIGLYYAIKSKKSTTTLEDYLVGGRNVGLLPVCCSIISTTITGTFTIALTAETYAYGSYNLMSLYILSGVGIITSRIILPVFVELKLTSTFKYFEMRFNRRVTLLASGLYVLTGLIYLPFLIYVPALTFQSVTGIDIYVTVTALSLICAIYTSIGGFRAVIWTDVIQLAVMLISFFIILTVGVYTAGGIGNVFDASSRGERFLVVNTTHHNARNSIWGWLISLILVATYQFGLSQTNMQRFMSLKNLKDMKKSIWIVTLVVQLFVILSVFLGVIIYATYETCDPFRAGTLKKVDQILPHYIQEKASIFLGFNGIFIAGIFSAGLSTSSSFLNALSGIIYEDFISQMYPRLQGNLPGRIMKTTVLILGVIQLSLVYFIEKMGTISKIAYQCAALNACSLLTLFTLGLLFPKANSTGAQWGAISSMISIFILIVGSMSQKPEPMLPLRTDGCENPRTLDFLNLTSNSTLVGVSNASDDAFWLFQINFIYYGLIGTVIGLSIGYIVSLLTGGNTVEDQKLLVTFFRKKQLPEEQETLQRKV